MKEAIWQKKSYLSPTAEICSLNYSEIMSASGTPDEKVEAGGQWDWSLTV